MEIDFEGIIQQTSSLAVTYGLKLILALFVLWIGWKACNFIAKGLTKLFQKTTLDEALETFLLSLASTALKILLIITCIGIAGFPTSSFIAVLGAAGLAVGMALSGTLQNFAGGVLILFLKPFKIGDVIETGGQTGKVKNIQIFNTIINTPDNKRVILPNGPVSTSTLVNYSSESTRRVELVFGISYDDDIDKAKALLAKIIHADKRVLQSPEPLIAVHTLGASSVDIIVRVWGNSDDYWPLTFDLTETVKKAFDEASISFPYPQTDIHFHKLEA